MKNFSDILKSIGWIECSDKKYTSKYPNAGNTFYISTSEFEGYYWYFETDLFIFNIHDLLVKKETTIKSFPDIKPYMSFSTEYIKSGSGKFFNPYQELSSNSIFVLNIQNSNIEFMLDANSFYFSVGMNLKKDAILKLNNLNIDSSIIDDMFFCTKEGIVSKIENISNDLLNCSMVSPAAEMYFNAKAYEWISIVIEAFFHDKIGTKANTDDYYRISKVKEYIEFNYKENIPQNELEKIALMSKTKLKKSFKNITGMTITEFTQRKRIEASKYLLLNTDLSISSISKRVGYTSHSRFTYLFKYYTGIYPKDMRKIKSKK